MIATKRIDVNTFESTLKNAGKVVTTTRTVYSKDGKLKTITAQGTDEAGKATNTVAVYDRQ